MSSEPFLIGSIREKILKIKEKLKSFFITKFKRNLKSMSNSRYKKHYS